MKRVFFAIALTLVWVSQAAAQFAAFQAANGVGATLALPASNNVTTNWQMAGLLSVGGIPTGRPQCGLTINPTGITPPLAGDDILTINAAIAACPSGQKVVLAGNTFQADQSESIIIQKDVTLTGSGSNVGSCGTGIFCWPTVINFRNGLLPWTGGECGVNTGSVVACNNGPGAVVFWSPGAANRFDFGLGGSLGHCGLQASAIGCGTQLDADAAQGATTIQVHTTTGLSVGQIIMIDEATGAKFQNDPVGPNLYGQVWAAPDWQNTSPSPATGRVQWAKFASCVAPYCDTSGFPYVAPGTIQSQYDRATTEMHKITAFANNSNCPGVGCTVTFDSPLMVAYRVSGMTTFTGSIASTTLTTTGDNCTLAAGQIVDDAAHVTLDGTYVTAINSCSAGAGNYTVNLSQTVTSRAMIGGAHQAHLYWSTNSSGTPISFLQNAGIENLTINRAQSGGINYQFCYGCWGQGVEIVNWGGGLGTSGGAVNFNQTFRSQLQFSFLNNCGNSVNAGGEYPIGLQNMSSENLIVDDIVIKCGKGMVGKSGGGNVVAYVYQDMQFYDAYSGIGDWFADNGVNGAHWGGTHHDLFEGNFSPNLDGDDIHGNSVYHVFLRNWGTGLRSDFFDPSCPTQCTTAVSDKSPFAGGTSFTTQGGKGWSCPSMPASCVTNGTGFLRAAGPMIHMLWHAYLGNVLGTPSITTAANNWTYRGSEATNIAIWASGWNSDAAHASVMDPNLDGTNSPQFLFKNCNYDYVSAAIVDCASGFTSTIPNSLYLPSSGASPPSWWPSGTTTYPFPWVTASSGTKIQSNSLAGSALPAKARYDAGTPFVQP